MDYSSNARHEPAANLLARILPWLTAAFLLICWMLGGVTLDATSADELLQLLALPIIVLAGACLLAKPLTGVTRLGLVLMAAVLALPLWQLLPLPHAAGMGGAARAAISADLASAGLVPGTSHASLSRFATDRALWALMPALATYLACLAMPASACRRMLQCVLGLVLASAAFAFFQLTLPDSSPLLLFTSWGRTFGGLFVNANHQGSALVIGAVIAASLFMQGRRRARQDHTGSRIHWLYAVVCLACSLMVPLAGSSAAMLLLGAGLVVLAIMLGVVRKRSLKAGRGNALRIATLAGVVMVVLASALAWLQSDGERRGLAVATTHIGTQFAPLGTGFGSFVPIYAQYQNLGVARSELINHAHDEYVQWWLEGGVPALLVLAFGLGVFAWAGWQVLARMPSARLRAIAAPAWTSLLVLLMHSLVDFPLRTTSLMATAALLAGIVFRTVRESRPTRTAKSAPCHADAALHRA